MKKLILFINSGRTDLQVLIQENREYYRVETAKENLRAFHQALLDNTINYQISNNFVKKHRDYDAIWDNKQLYLKKWNAKNTNEQSSLIPVKLLKVFEKLNKHLKKQRENYATDAKIVTDEQGSIQLIPAKLLRVVEKLNKDYQVFKVVVFYTHRENDRQEPIAVGKLLADWLKDYFRLTTDDVSYVNILPNRKRIEGPDDKDYPINRDTVKIIDQTVHKLAELADKDTIACVSATGMQDVKNLIKACVRLHFSPSQERFMEMEVKERDDKAVEIKQIPTAVDSFHTREHAIALIQQGDFAGAYGAVKHLENDPNEKIWVTKVADVSDYFAGKLEYSENLSDYLKYFAKQNSPRCLLVAMRTETALLSGRIADAISLTCTFFDAAILDAIEKNLPVSINEIEKQMVFSQGYNVSEKLTKNNKPCLKLKNGFYEYNPMNNCFYAWFFSIMAKKVVFLERYGEALRTKISIDGSELKPKDLRNVNTHSLLKSGQLEIAKKIFINAGFWKLDDKPIAGSCFLAQPLLDNVLKELGQSNISKPYAQLIEGICGELKN